MSPDRNNSDDTPDGPSDDPSSLLEQIRSVIEELAEIEQEEGGNRQETGHINRKNTRIDYGYDVSVGLGSNTASSPDRSASDRSQPDGTVDREAQEPSIRVETREVSDNELIVIADLPGITDDDLDVTLDADEPALELRDGEDIVERVALDQSNVTISDVSIKNQILEIRLTKMNKSNNGDSDE